MTDDQPHQSPLGHASDYPDRYAPDVLHSIPRAAGRATIGLDADLPFKGVDIWNAWELTWLDPGGKPTIATATLCFAAETTNIVESKSLKLYMTGFANTRYVSPDEVANIIGADLARLAEGPVTVALSEPADFERRSIAALPGRSIDDLDVSCDDLRDVDPGLLQIADGGDDDKVDDIVDEALQSHLLRSLCPVTAQPDTGSVSIRYRGPRIDPASLLRYLVSFRNHDDFHEACVERIFVDLLGRCCCEQLSVYARYNRRGGIDINPFRSNVTATTDDLRLWRQ